MFQTRNACRDENAQVADMRIGQVDDALAGLLEVGSITVDRRNSAKRLERRVNVVTVRGENHDRIADPAQVGRATLADPEQILLDLVADKEILDNGEDLLAAQKVETIPPTLELEKAILFVIDVAESMGVFLPNCFLGFEVLKVLRQPGAAEQAAGHTHRVGAGFTAQ